MNLKPIRNFKPIMALTPIVRAISCLTLVLTLSACSNLGVKPWERETLARPEMQLIHDAVEAGLDDHIYFSKEASSGGRGFGGGGCGCN